MKLPRKDLSQREPNMSTLCLVGTHGHGGQLENKF